MSNVWIAGLMSFQMTILRMTAEDYRVTYVCCDSATIHSTLLLLAQRSQESLLDVYL